MYPPDINMELSSETISNPSKPGFIQSIIERRLHRTVIVYLGATWTVFGIVQWIVNRYVLSPYLEELFLMIALLFLPAVLIIGYGHGAKGKQKWTQFEKVGLSCNAIIAVALLFFMFGDKDLGSAREVVQVVDVEGNAIERVVPKDIFRKRMSIFFFDNESGDEDLDWLQEAIPGALDVDLDQDLFFVSKSAIEFTDKFQKAGFEDGLGIPTALKRSITSDYNLSYFITGSINKQGDDFVVQTELHDVDKGQEIASHEYTSANIFDIVDMITADLKSDLDLPKQHIEETKDLPVVDLLTESEDALKSYRNGLQTLTVQRDFNGAAAHFQEATQIDPTFALSHLYHYIVMLQQGQMQPALQSLGKAQQHNYRLSEQLKYLVKVAQLNLSGNQEQALEATKQWASLFPDDMQAHQILGMLHSIRGEYDDAIAAYRNLLQADPFQDQVDLQVGELLKETGKEDEAIAHYQAFNEKYPDRNDGLKKLADVYYEQANLEQALETQMKALSVSPDDPSAVRNVADILKRQGEFDNALRRLENALSLSTSPSEQVAAHFEIGSFYWFRGQHQDAISSYNTGLDIVLENSSALEHLVRRAGLVNNYYEAGYPELAKEIVEEAINSPAAKQFPDLAAIASDAASYIEAKEGNPEEGLLLLDSAKAMADAAGFNALESMLLYSRSFVLLESKQYDEAQSVIESYLELNPHSVGGLNRMGKIMYETGDFKAAKRNYEKAILYSPAGSTGLLGLAKAEIALGNEADAKVHLEKALKTLENADDTSETAKEVNELLQTLTNQ